ncbi:MAG: HlyD family type I secretion periplasmic adaptor subunit [Alphaproteobacteria bacterium]|nr:HlyD family type I secretion periplasmic adaptor subunit [Alphaproteobacteria bacterium]
MYKFINNLYEWFSKKVLNKPDHYETDFLPAAMEVLETPPSPAGRSLAILISVFVGIAIIWACVGKVDIIAVAQGKIVPSGQTKTIQAFEMGIVKRIEVIDGQEVKAGDLLIELDTTTSEADSERLSKELMNYQLDAARLRAILSDGDINKAFIPPAGADDTKIRLQIDLLKSQRAEFLNHLAALDREYEQSRANIAAIDAQRKKLEATIPLMKERVKSRQILADKDLAPRMTLLELQQQLISMEQDLTATQARSNEARAQMSSIERQKEQARAEFRRTRLAELADAEQRISSLQQELIKAEQRQVQQKLVSPVDGTVQQLAVHTIGGVVQPAQPLMIIVPKQARLESEAMVLNRDIGFVATNQEASVKLEAFPFTRYGTINGKVVVVSHDAIQDEKMGLIYAIRVELEKSTMNVDGKTVQLSPGMTTTIEIKTGKRRIIDYLLSPLQKYSDESLRER